MTTENNEEKKL